MNVDEMERERAHAGKRTLRKISDVEQTEYGDPVTWKDRCSPFILIAADGSVDAGNRVGEKRDLLEREGTLIFPWVGRYSTDVFEVDDRARARRGLGRA